jgi:hypothetical protein
VTGRLDDPGRPERELAAPSRLDRKRETERRERDYAERVARMSEAADRIRRSSASGEEWLQRIRAL